MDRQLGRNQPTPAIVHFHSVPWTVEVREWLTELGASMNESRAVLRDLTVARKVPPTREEVADTLNTLRQVVADYLRSLDAGDTDAANRAATNHPKTRDLAAERRAAHEADKEARQREQLLAEEERRRAEAQKREAEQIVAARQHALERELAEPAKED